MNTHAEGTGGRAWTAVKDALELAEQAAATGWYPARRLLLSRLSELTDGEPPAWVPEADLRESAAELLVTFALPGVEKADIRVEATENVLTVSGRRADETKGARLEQAHGRFLRRVRLPAEVRPLGAKASYRNGLLKVSLPRARAACGRSVKVE